MNHLRNFAIIAHIDHGKSTLADRLLEITGTVSSRLMKNQLLDSNPIERERGITIKLAPVRMAYSLAGKDYILNLIDTPGHVDFSYEVNRSLAACEGAILLVDATQGVQAQTLAHYHQALRLGLTVIPVINKIDIATADIPASLNQLQQIFGFTPSQVLQVSAKTGQGIPELLQEIVARIPAPVGQIQSPVRALVFNSNFDPHLGVVAWVRLIDGLLNERQQLYLLNSQISTPAVELGYFVPHRHRCPQLAAGEVGFVVTGLKDPAELQVGDTLAGTPNLIPLPGYQPVKPVVFVSLYPLDGEEINTLRDALHKLRLQDASLQFTAEFSPALGNGFRVGLLGLLHADIVQERLEREFGLPVIAVAPSVGYRVHLNSGVTLSLSKAMDLPDPSLIRSLEEPLITASVFTPEQFVGPVMQLCQQHRGQLLDMQYHGQLVSLRYSLPLAELIRQFYDRLKSVSQGFATLDYELAGFIDSDLVRLDILISGQVIDALSQIVPKGDASRLGREFVDKLHDLIPRQQFEIPIQAAVGSRILARRDIKAFRKDVIAKLSGGDQTRKDKLLNKQKAGKSRLKRFGKVDIPQEAFLSLLRL